MEPETNHHAMINCSKAIALRHMLYEEWNLPDDSFFRYTGPDWALILLSHVSDQMRSKLLFMWWRTWHLRNNMIFGDGKCSIEQSAIFLQSYLHTMQGSREIEVTANPKGKQPMLVQLNVNSDQEAK
jgi:hypothetical protein